MDMVVAGGPIVVLLILLSLLSLTIIIAKVISMRGVLSGGGQRAKALEAWASGDRISAIASLERGGSPADRVALAAMQGLVSGQRRPLLEADVEWRGNVEVAQMSRHLQLLELIAMVSPLLGLLGTVLGMIKAFQDLSLAGGSANASLLAGGIWEALLTTAAGLIVAIPAAVAAGLLSERADHAAQQIEGTIGRLFAIEEAKL